MKYRFLAKETTEALIKYLQSWFEQNGPGCNAVIGISGGKDSTIAAALCVKALGAERVIGVLLPNGVQHDFNVAQKVCETLGIKNLSIPIGTIFEEFQDGYKMANVHKTLNEVTEQARINLAPRIRMTMLRYVAQANNGRLINTSNLSEDWVGYATVDGDSAGDVSPLCMLTVQEVKAIGHELGLPAELVEKVPEDGLVGTSDEQALGITYKDIDTYIREGEGSAEVIEKINKKFEANKFKIYRMASMPCFWPEIEMLFDLTEKPTNAEIMSLGMAKDPRFQ